MADLGVAGEPGEPVRPVLDRGGVDRLALSAGAADQVVAVLGARPVPVEPFAVGIAFPSAGSGKSRPVTGAPGAGDRSTTRDPSNKIPIFTEKKTPGFVRRGGRSLVDYRSAKRSSQ